MVNYIVYYLILNGLITHNRSILQKRQVPKKNSLHPSRRRKLEDILNVIITTLRQKPSRYE